MEKSPFVEDNGSCKHKSKCHDNATCGGAESPVFRYLIYAGVIIAAVIILYIIFINNKSEATGSSKSESFLVNTVKSDPASDWNLQSEIDKLTKLQERYLSRLRH